MRLGVSYNYYNGDEHFLASLRAMRPHADHISVVWQTVSNAGEPISEQARVALCTAARRGWVDTIEHFSPDLTAERAWNETEKRRLGLELARQANASHFLGLDTDELYRSEELQRAKEQIASNGWRSTSVSSFLHIQRPIYRARDKTNCCFIVEIMADTRIGVPEFPCDTVDATRKMTADADTHHHFSPDVVAMYHMNLIRRDLAAKLRNSSSRDAGFLDEVARTVADWRFGLPLVFPKKGELAIEMVPNEFGTFDPGAPATTQPTA